MITSEQISSLFSYDEPNTDYDEEKRKKKQLLVRNEFEKSGKYGMPLIRKQKVDLDKIQLLNYMKTKQNDKENIFLHTIGILVLFMKNQNWHSKNLINIMPYLHQNLAHIKTCLLLDK